MAARRASEREVDSPAPADDDTKEMRGQILSALYEQHSPPVVRGAQAASALATELRNREGTHPRTVDFATALERIGSGLPRDFRLDLANAVSRHERGDKLSLTELPETTATVNQLENVGREIQRAYAGGPASNFGHVLVRQAQDIRRGLGQPAGAGPEPMLRPIQRPGTAQRQEPQQPVIPYDKEAEKNAQREKFFGTLENRELEARSRGDNNSLRALFEKYPEMGESYTKWKRRRQ